ncbi:TPA: toll/interleukin-1 receptor domain-containing protein [Vibrio vulnificus]|nr:toll/interleukin-1 receptor domain-containing protein [Vibrio vulnificus]
MYKSIFISYGGPDEDSVSMLNKKLKTVGVTTWFFPNDSIPGQKLHRMMHEGVNKHDKVLLVCSKCSLTRAGVLNEIERVLEREAKEGGSDILIPVTLDQYVFDGWKPDRTDIADQLKSRVIINVDPTDDNYDLSIEKLVKALKS